MMLAWVLAAAVGCSSAPEQSPKPADAFAPKVPSIWASSAEGKRVLVLWNRPHPDGEKLALYYASKRGVPRENVLRVVMDAGENTNTTAFTQGIVPLVTERVKASKDPIDYIVLVKGVPLRIFDETNFGYSLDSFVSTMLMPSLKAMKEPSQESFRRVMNPYLGKNEPFSREKFGFFLVTRLDGYTYADAKRLVDNSVAAKPEKGPFFLDAMGQINNEGYAAMDKTLIEASTVLGKKGMQVTLERTPEFAKPDGPVMGYCSWGSNDHRFVAANYLGVRFKPGALAETFVSTSGRTMEPVTGGQSVVTDLIKNGVTGVKGYVMEPYTLALARPQILFDRYTSGYNLAESFSMASPVLKWRDIVFGDPLCRPYKKP